MSSAPLLIPIIYYINIPDFAELEDMTGYDLQCTWMDLLLSSQEIYSWEFVCVARSAALAKTARSTGPSK